MQNKYSCGSDPQPGDVVEVVTMEDLPEESWWNQAITEKLQKEKHYSVFAVAFGDWICLFNKPEIIWHHPSRFRLIRRAGEQPQPDMAKMLEEKEREIERLKEQVNDLKMDAAAHEYNEIERLRYQEEYERQLLEEKDEAIRELETELDKMTEIKDYWYNRCYQAEQYIEKSPCDPDITKEQIDAYKIWQESKKQQP